MDSRICFSIPSFTMVEETKCYQESAMGSFTAKKPRNIRENNVKLLVDLYYTSKGLSVSEISKKLELSRTTISKINNILISTGLILPDGKGDSSDAGGKKPMIFSLNKEYGLVLCFHVEDESIATRLLNMRLETVYAEDLPIRKDLDLDSLGDMLHALYRRVVSLDANRRIIGIAVAVHALVDSREGICHYATHFPSWGRNIPLADKIAKSLNTTMPIFIDNWIRFKASAVHETGIIPKHDQGFILVDAGKHGVVAGISFGNGMGMEGSHLAGEIGHMVVNPSDERICHCGGRGCLESMLDFDRILGRAHSLKATYPESTVFSGETPLDMDRVFQAFRDGDPLAHVLMDEVTDWLAIGLSNVNQIFFPELLILEGDFGRAGPAYERMLREKADRISMVRMKNKVPLVFRESHEQDTLRGAVAYVLDRYINELKLDY